MLNMINKNDKTTTTTKRYKELFQKLDVNSDGKINVNDLLRLFETTTATSTTQRPILDNDDTNAAQTDQKNLSRAKVKCVIINDLRIVNREID
jgi:Ca2+-binding EF-hand superfamily protein